MIPTVTPVVLPFNDPLRGRRGHQFGLCNEEGSTDILVLFENGDTERTLFPILIPPNRKEGKPAQPHQHWVYARLPEDEGQLSIHRVHAPKKGPGSSPITKRTLKPRHVYSPSKSAENGVPHFVKRPIISTPSGRDYFRACIDEHAPGAFRFDLCSADFDGDYPVPTSFVEYTLANGLYDEVLKIDVTLGTTPFASVWVQDEVLLGVQPERFALEHELWTSHLVAGVFSQLDTSAARSNLPSTSQHDVLSIESLREEIALAVFNNAQAFEALGDGLLEPAAAEVALAVLQHHGFWAVDEFKHDEIGNESVLLSRVTESGLGLAVTTLELQTCPEGFRPYEHLILRDLPVAGQAFFDAGNVEFS